jgi:hypothetical protein
MEIGGVYDTGKWGIMFGERGNLCPGDGGILCLQQIVF